MKFHLYMLFYRASTTAGSFHSWWLGPVTEISSYPIFLTNTSFTEKIWLVILFCYLEFSPKDVFDERSLIAESFGIRLERTACLDWPTGLWVRWSKFVTNSLAIWMLKFCQVALFEQCHGSCIDRKIPSKQAICFHRVCLKYKKLYWEWPMKIFYLISDIECLISCILFFISIVFRRLRNRWILSGKIQPFVFCWLWNLFLHYL